MIETTLVCFLVYAQPDVDTGNLDESKVQLVCVDTEDEATTDNPEVNEEKVVDKESVYKEETN